MASKKPVIHGFDHLPGGYDPIPDLDLPPYSPNSAEEHLFAVSLTVGSNVNSALSFSHYDGTSLVDISTATKLLCKTQGVFACSTTVTVDLAGGSAVGTGVEVQMLAVQSGIAWPPGYTPPSTITITQPDDGVNIISGAVAIPAALMATTDWFQLHVFNRTPNSVDVRADVSVVRIIQS